MIIFRSFPFLYLPFFIRSCSPLLASSSTLPRTVWPHTAGSPWYVLYVHIDVFFHTYTYTRMCMYVHLSLYVHVYSCVHVYIQLSTHRVIRLVPIRFIRTLPHYVPFLCSAILPILPYHISHNISSYCTLSYTTFFVPVLCSLIIDSLSSHFTFLLTLSLFHRILSFFWSHHHRILSFFSS